MAKGFRFLFTILISVILFSSVYAQERKYNTLYKPLPVVKRLSYENYKNIKLLQSAIINYGGGEAEVEKLVDQYAEASALFFQNKIEDSADKFTENSREILKTTQKILNVYKLDTNMMIMEGIKFNIKNEFSKSLTNERKNEVAEKYLNNARFAFAKAEDIYNKLINATNAPPEKLITAIYYYRRAKENILLMYEVTKMDGEKKNKILAEYKKDIEDNKNKVYISKEKKN